MTSVESLTVSKPGEGPGIVLAESAARRLAHLAETEGHPVRLRVAVDGGGCSGFQYRFELIETAEADDLVIETDGQVLLIDPVSVPFLNGSEVAFQDLSLIHI